jgi:hypothetical protein
MTIGAIKAAIAAIPDEVEVMFVDKHSDLGLAFWQIRSVKFFDKVGVAEFRNWPESEGDV